MTEHDDLGRALTRWFEADALSAAPASVLRRSIEVTQNRRPFGTLRARVGSEWVERGWRVHVPGFPWRLVGAVALLIVGVVGAAVFVGSRQPRLPTVTGPAANGRVAYELEGDIYVGDPANRTTTAIVTGPSIDSRPIFSPDGTRIVFMRGSWTAADASILVVRADGSDERIIVPPGFSGRGLGFAWMPDGAFVAVNHDSRPFTTPYFDGELSLVDASGVAEPRLLTPPLPFEPGAPYFSPNAQVAPIFRPPRGDRIVAGRAGTLVLEDVDGTNRTELVGPSRDDIAFRGVMEPVWSPDGSKIAFAGGLQALEASGLHYFMYVVNADGSDLRRLSREAVVVGPGQLVEERWPAWSPDGSRIVFDRGTYDANDCCSKSFQITVVDVDTGDERELDAPEIVVGPLHSTPYPGQSWSPDGRGIVVLERPGTRPLVIDVESGEASELPWEADSPPSWHRLAGD